jgi:hypothetical protein
LTSVQFIEKIFETLTKFDLSFAEFYKQRFLPFSNIYYKLENLMEISNNNTLNYKIPESHIHKLPKEVQENKELISLEIFDITSLKSVLLNLINLKKETFKMNYTHGTNPIIQLNMNISFASIFLRYFEMQEEGYFEKIEKIEKIEKLENEKLEKEISEREKTEIEKIEKEFEGNNQKKDDKVFNQKTIDDNVVEIKNIDQKEELINLESNNVNIGIENNENKIEIVNINISQNKVNEIEENITKIENTTEENDNKKIESNNVENNEVNKEKVNDIHN